MIRLPDSFVKIHYPGYFFCVDTETLWSIKVTGTLRQMKLQKAYYGFAGNGKWCRRRVDRPEGWTISHYGKAITLSREEILRRYGKSNPEGLDERVDFRC